MQILANGILNGLIIALMALAFQLVYLPTRVFHVALGGIYVVAPYVAWICLKGGVPWYVSFAASLGFCALFAIAIDVFNHSPRGDEPGTLVNLTNGPYGLRGIPKPEMFGFEFISIESIAVLFTAFAALSLLFCRTLLSSPWGRMLKALRDDELAARGLGKFVRMAKVQAIAISCAMAAFGGVLYASYISYIDPSTASLADSLLLLTMIIVGGVGNTFRGPLVGAFVLLAIPESLRFADLPDVMAGELRLLIYGLLLIAMMHFRPQGLAGEYRLG